MHLPVGLPRQLPGRSFRLLPLCALILASCAAPPPESQDVQRFYPDSEQLLSRTARLLDEDGVPERHGLTESFYPDGKPQSRSSFVRGVPDGEFQQWHAGGAPACEGRYAMGRRVGQWSLWDEHGVLRERSTWRDGILDGEAAAWDANGQRVWVGTYAHGRRQGNFEAFHPNGQVRVRGVFESGEPHGRFTAFYADGTRADEGRYKGGHPDGSWVCWNPEGVLVLQVSLRHGGTETVALPEALKWDPAQAPAASPFDLAAVFAMQPSSDEPELPAVVLAPTRKPAPAKVTAKAAPPAPPADDGNNGGPARVGVN